MSDRVQGRGRGRGKGKSEPVRPGSPSSPNASFASTGSNGNGRSTPGRGRGRGVRRPETAEDVQAAAVGMEQLTLMEPTDGATKEPSVEPKKKEEKPEEETFEQAMLRPGIGKEGRRIGLHANHFPISVPVGMSVHHYDLVVAREFKRKKGAAKATEPKPKKKDAYGDEDDETMSVEEVIGEEGEFEVVLRRRTKWPKWLLRAIYCKLVLEDEFGLIPYRYRMAFDGAKNVYSQCSLPIPASGAHRMNVQIPGEQRSDNFVVKLNHVEEIAVNIREVFSRRLLERKSMSTLVLDIIMRQSRMMNDNFVAVGPRAFYEPPKPDPLGGGLVRYPGIWSSIRPVSGWKSTVNLDVANTAFVKPGPVLNIVNEISRDWQRRPLQWHELKTLEKTIRGLKVNMDQRAERRSARCIGVTRESASQLKFEHATVGGGSSMITVEYYFNWMFDRKEFIRKLEYPHLPCLHVGNKTKKNYVPLEFCSVQGGQRYNGKLSDQQTSAMLRAATLAAPDRKCKIEEEVERFDIQNDPYLEAFGLKFEVNMMKVLGRVLAPPSVEHGDKKIVAPRNGEWRMTGMRVIKGATVRRWGAINTDERTNVGAISNFCRRLVSAARNVGINFETDEPIHYVENNRADNIEGILEEMKRKGIPKDGTETTLDLVFVVLAGKNTPFYSSTKSAGDVVLGVNTQCVLGKNVQKCDPSLISNILLKINAKLGGVNSKLSDESKQKIPLLYSIAPETKQVLWEPILILGADVNHPAPTDAEGTPSVAAVVANMDMLPARYAAKIMVQQRRQEPIAELQSAVERMIYNFFENNGRQLPKRIIMYRDGVGESMFLKVLTDELHAIRRACEKMGAYCKIDQYEPPITFIVVQKRHHTRLFCTDKKDEVGRGRNIPPGTTVDTDIVHPEENDFYLCSHLGLQGTSRPTHYHVLWDDSDFTADDLQKLTYYLCYTYARALKAVSIPPPCYYADLVAYRARQYIAWKWPSGSDTASSRSEPSVSMDDLQSFVAVQDIITEKGMYFV